MKYIFVIIILLTCISCGSQITIPNTGLVELKMEFYDTTGNQRLNPNMTFIQKIWYEDSFAIEEIMALNSVTDTNNITTTTHVIQGYRLNDFRGQTVYTFKTFSDTAEIKGTYSFTDNRTIIGGWGFNEKKELKYIGEPIALKDTIENNVILKRLRLERRHKSLSFTSTLYFNCKAPAFFDMDPKLTRQVGCPCTGVFSYKADRTVPPNISTFDFLRDHLLPAEKAVFAAWKKKIGYSNTQGKKR